MGFHSWTQVLNLMPTFWFITIHHYWTVFIWQFFFRIYLSSGHFFLTCFQKTTSLAVNCEQILFIRMRDLKQLGFFEWRTTTGSGLFAFLRSVFWPNCLYKSEDTRQYKLGNIEAYLKGKVLTSGWRASLKNVSLKFAAEINTSFADHNKCSRKTLEWYLISERKNYNMTKKEITSQKVMSIPIWVIFRLMPSFETRWS